MLPVDGTSASSPSTAGLLSLINSQLIANGKSPIGFANPALYQMFASDPSAFNDITQGNNNCNRAYCCQYGWRYTLFFSLPRAFLPFSRFSLPPLCSLLSFSLFLFLYSASQGWDPATGLGSPNFPNMVKYFLNAKGISTN